MNCGQCTMRTLMGVLGLFFLLCGFICVIVGSVAAYGNNKFHLPPEAHPSDLRNGAAVLIFVGFCFVAAGIAGCCNMWNERKACQYFFFVFLFLIVALMITAAVLGEKFHSNFETGLALAFMNYNESKEGIDYMQRKAKCCGFYNSSSYGTDIPDSCYADKSDPSTLYKEGCYTLYKEIVAKYSKYIVGAVVGLFVIMLLAMCGTCYMACQKRSNYSGVK